MSQFLYSEGFYNVKGSIGRVGHIVSAEHRIMRIEIKDNIGIEGIGLSLLLELPINVLSCIGRFYGRSSYNKKFLAVPLMRLNSITCINGINGFNVSIPEFVYFISNMPGPGQSKVGAVGIKNEFSIDLSKIVGTGSNKYNVYQRPCGLLNIVYNNINFKVSGQLQSCIAKLVNLPKITHINSEGKEVASGLASFQSPVKKDLDWRKLRHRFIEKVKPLVVALNADVLTAAVLKIILNSR